MGVKLKHPVRLPEEERTRLHTLIHKGVANTRTITRARVLVLADAGKTDKEIYTALDLSVSTPYDIRKRYHAGGLANALYDTPHPRRGRKLTGGEEAEVVAISCTKRMFPLDTGSFDRGSTKAGHRHWQDCRLENTPQTGAETVAGKKCGSFPPLPLIL